MWKCCVNHRPYFRHLSKIPIHKIHQLQHLHWRHWWWGLTWNMLTSSSGDSLEFSILPRDTSTCRPGESNQRPSDNKTREPEVKKCQLILGVKGLTKGPVSVSAGCVLIFRCWFCCLKVYCIVWATVFVLETHMLVNQPLLTTKHTWHEVMDCCFWRLSVIFGTPPTFSSESTFVLCSRPNCSPWANQRGVRCLPCLHFCLILAHSECVCERSRLIICWILKPSVGVHFILRTSLWCVVCLPFITEHVKHPDSQIRLAPQNDETMSAHSVLQISDGRTGLRRVQPCALNAAHLCRFMRTCRL